MNRICSKCGKMYFNEESFCPDCGMQLQMCGEWQEAPKNSMKWYKFIVYFGLYILALINVSNAVLYFSGWIYKGDAPIVYAYYSELRVVDIAVGILSLMLAVFCINVRQKLKRFSSDGPKSFIRFLFIRLVIDIVYIILASVILETVILDEKDIIRYLVTSIAVIFLNRTYFEKRKHLFINS